jgi:hypothetical protein
LIFSKPIKKSEQYKEGKKKNKVNSPGPQEYFQSTKFDRSNSAKKRQFPRDDLDKKCNKPLNKILF